MKKLPFIIGIPAIALVIVLAAALVWRLKNQAVDTASSPLPGAFGYQTAKPTNPFSALFGTGAEPTPSPASSADLNKDLQALNDDGGASDINSLKSDASGL